MAGTTAQFRTLRMRRDWLHLLGCVGCGGCGLRAEAGCPHSPAALGTQGPTWPPLLDPPPFRGLRIRLPAWEKTVMLFSFRVLVTRFLPKPRPFRCRSTQLRSYRFYRVSRRHQCPRATCVWKAHSELFNLAWEEGGTCLEGELGAVTHSRALCLE